MPMKIASDKLASVAPLGDRRKSDFQRKTLEHPALPLISGKAELTGLFTDAQFLAPKASLGACDSLAAGLCGEAGPGVLLCIASCALYLVGVINGVFSLSGVRAALLTSTKRTLK